MSSLGKFYTARPRTTKRRHRKVQPASPIPCRVVAIDGSNAGPFPSRSKAKRFMGSIIKNLPPKENASEPKKFWIENL